MSWAFLKVRIIPDRYKVKIIQQKCSNIDPNLKINRLTLPFCNLRDQLCKLSPLYILLIITFNAFFFVTQTEVSFGRLYFHVDSYKCQQLLCELRSDIRLFHLTIFAIKHFAFPKSFWIAEMTLESGFSDWSYSIINWNISLKVCTHAV